MKESEKKTHNPAGASRVSNRAKFREVLLNGEVLQGLNVKKYIPLILLWAIGGVVLVNNRYEVESKVKGKLEAQDRIIYLREKRVELQKRYQENIKISKIAERLQDSEVGITAGPPYEI